MIRWLCIDPDARKTMGPEGIVLWNAAIESALVLSFVACPRIKFQNCALRGEFVLESAEFPALVVQSCYLRSFYGADVRVKSMLRVANSTIAGPFILQGARVGSRVILQRSKFEQPVGRSIDLRGCQLDEDLSAEDIRVTADLAADGMSVGRAVTLSGATVNGTITMAGAKIGARLQLNKVTLGRGKGDALVADGASIGNDLSMESASIRGRFSLARAEVAGRVMISHRTIVEGSLRAESVTVRSSFELTNDSEVRGRLLFDEARVTFGLAIRNCIISRDDPRGLSLQNAHIDERVTLLESTFLGPLSFRGLRSSGVVEVDKCGVARALTLDRAAIRELRLHAVKIESMSGQFLEAGEATCDGCTVNGPIDFTGSRIEGDLVISSTAAEGINLSNATVGTLRHDKGSWPTQGKLAIDGLRYTNIDPGGDDRDERPDWINLQANPTPQSYEQLARYYQLRGQEQDAKRVAIEKQRAMRRRASMWARIGSVLSDLTIGYGWKPQRAFAWGLAVIIIGAVVFWYADYAGILMKDKDSGGRYFNPFVYSADLFIPLLDLEQAKYWYVDVQKGLWVQFYFWFQTVIGWILTSLAVAGLTGLVRRA